MCLFPIHLPSLVTGQFKSVVHSCTKLFTYWWVLRVGALIRRKQHYDLLLYCSLVYLTELLHSRIPGTGEPGGLPFLGSHRVGHDRSDLAAAAAGIVAVHGVEKNQTRLRDWTIATRYCFHFSVSIINVLMNIHLQKSLKTFLVISSR